MPVEAPLNASNAPRQQEIAVAVPKEAKPDQVTGSNISSGALDKEEVNTIATELRNQLNKPANTSHQNQEPNDTIAIDQDGTLHVHDQN
jgi:hypothetical protein